MEGPWVISTALDREITHRYWFSLPSKIYWTWGVEKCIFSVFSRVEVNQFSPVTSTFVLRRAAVSYTHLVKREIRDGTRAVILAPVKTGEAAEELENMNPGCPVILLGQSADEGGNLDSIGVDSREIGRLLGQAAASQAPGDVPVYLFCRGLDYGDLSLIHI